MNEQQEFEIHGMELEELEKSPPSNGRNAYGSAFPNMTHKDPAENCFAAEQLKWAQERLAQSSPGSFDADFLSGVILATRRLEADEIDEALSGIHQVDDGSLVSAWFASGFISTRLLWGRMDFSRLRFTPQLLESVMAAMRLKYDA